MSNNLLDDCTGVCGQKCFNFIFYGNTLFSGFCLFVAMILAGIQTVQHLRNYSNPYFQNKILSIIFAAPFYGITSYLVIVTKDSIGFWIVLRSVYDSVLIYFFFNLITSYVAFDQDTINMDIMYEAIHEKKEIPHSFPFKYFLKPIKITSTDRARFFYLTCKNNMMQFFVLNALLTFFNCILALIGGLQIWININNAILFISIGFCLYYLVLFYAGLEVQLRPYRPLLKFLAIKGIIFFTFWQEMAINLSQDKLLGLFNSCNIPDFEKQQHYILNSASCMLVCFEMIILTLMTSIAYSYKDFETAVHGPLKKRLIINVFAENIREQMHDLAEYDMIKNLAFTKKTQVVTISEKGSTTSYYDEYGNLVDAKDEAVAKLYQSRIEVIPDSLAIHSEVRDDFTPLEK